MSGCKSDTSNLTHPSTSWTLPHLDNHNSGEHIYLVCMSYPN